MKKLTLFAFMLGGFLSQAQNNLTIEEATLGAQRGFGTKAIYGAQWRTNNELTYIDATYKALVSKKTDKSTVENFVTTADLESAIATATNEKVSLRTIPFDYHWENEKEFAFTYQGENDKYFVIYNVETKKVSKTIKFNASSAEEIIAPNKNYIVYLNKNNVEIVLNNGEVVKVTNDPDHVINGSSSTHRNEFGIDRGMWVSPDSKKILFYKKDERM
ncbi:MAG: DPP IV N-terminal domain-containing protein, partial [Myroides sp.]